MINEPIEYTTPNALVKVYASTEPLFKERVCNMHFHSEIELLYVTAGKMGCFTEDESYIAGEGEIIFINSRIPHYTEYLEDGTGYIMVQLVNPVLISGDVKYLARYLAKTEVSCYVFKKNDEKTEYFAGKIRNISDETLNGLKANEFYILSIIYEMAGFLRRYGFLYDEGDFPDQKRLNEIMPIIEYIEENYAENITLYDVSAKLNLNRNYICRLFKKATGGTVMDYLNFVRICKSENLLKSGMRVAEVAYLMGFSSQSYFHKVFKKYNFFAPSEYKKIRSFNQKQ